MHLSSHICVCEGNPISCRTLTGIQTVLQRRLDGCTGILDSSRTLKSVRTCCHDVHMDATLNCSKLLDTDGRPDNIAMSSRQMLLTDERPDVLQGRLDGNDFSKLESV
jgi:hypothetical protein